MSTRAIIGIPTKTGFSGSYLHSDGYPSWVGSQLQQMVLSQGMNIVTETILSCEWSVLRADQYDPAELPVVPAEARATNVDYRSAQYRAIAWRDNYAPMGCTAYPGIGIDFPEDHALRTEESNVGARWAYALHESGIVVWFNDRLFGGGWVHLGNVRYDAEGAMEALQLQVEAEQERRLDALPHSA